MDKYKNKYRIESNRTKFWDYSSPGDYFITICIADRENILGHVDNGKMILSEYGKIVESEIKKMRKQRRKMLIPKILGKFKQQTSKNINILRNTPEIRNWQSNYYDHIIRNDAEHYRIKNYIINNPQKWDDDKFYNQSENTGN